MDSQQMQSVYNGMSADEKAVVDAIRIANNFDEKEAVDSIIKDVRERRARFFDIIYIDLSIDRSSKPLQISGAGTGLIGLEATDNTCFCEVAYEVENGNTNERMQMRRGKRFFGPFANFYIYHTAQAGKSIKLLRVFATKSLTMGFQDDSGEAANSDLVTALGNSSVFDANQVTVPATAGGIVIKAANVSRKRITITNLSAGQDVYIKKDNTVTTANGHGIPPKGSITLNCTGAIYGIVAAGTEQVSYLEE